MFAQAAAFAGGVFGRYFAGGYLLYCCAECLRLAFAAMYAPAAVKMNPTAACVSAFACGGRLFNGIAYFTESFKAVKQYFRGKLNRCCAKPQQFRGICGILHSAACAYLQAGLCHYICVLPCKLEHKAAESRQAVAGQICPFRRRRFYGIQ